MSASISSSSSGSESDSEPPELHTTPATHEEEKHESGGADIEMQPLKSSTSKEGSGSEKKNKSNTASEKSPSGSDAEGLIGEAPIDAVLKHLRASRNGLDAEEVRARLEQYGPNKLPEKTVNPLLQFLLFFWNPLSWAMEVAAVLAMVLGDYADFILIMLLLVLNAVIGFWEEHSSGKAMEALKGQLAPLATCLRDGQFSDISAFDLVPGDIIHLTLGDVVPADVKLLEGESVKLDQSSLTGESLPVNKYSGDEVFAGSTVKEGDINAVVYATGIRTFFGRAANLVSGTESHGHFQTVLKTIGFFCLSFIAVGVAVELIVQFAIKGEDCTGVEWSGDLCVPLTNILVLIMGGIPIAMPTVLSVTMAMGAARLAKKNAIVARLTAVEEVAGMDILCSDKTGTLTLNQLTVGDPRVFSEEFTERSIIFDAALAASQVSPDAIDTAMLNSLTEEERKQLDTHEVIKYKPFDPISKRSTAVVMNPKGEYFKTAKGAPQVILNMAHNKEEIEDDINALIDEYAGKGFRTLGVARAAPDEGEDPTNPDAYTSWTMEGLIPLYDPPRHDTEEVIRKVQENGIQVKMITGDQMAIAVETARQLGMGQKIYNPKALEDAGENSHLVEEADGFSQVFPEHKYDIVARLQKFGHTVGMTGDGVNDAPALKKADIGIAVADATDAARAASDIVLLSPGLGVIVDAIFGSRKIFQRMRNYTIYSVSSTVRIVLTFTILTLAYDFYFPTILIAILAVLNDGTILTISKDRAKPSQTPDEWNLPVIFCLSIVIGVYLTISTIVLFIIVEETTWFEDWFTLDTLDFDRIRGLVYIQVSLSAQSAIFVTRSNTWFFKSRPSYLLIAAFLLAQIGATIIGIFGFNGYPDGTEFRGCGWGYALLAWIWCGLWFIPLDPIKVLTYHIVTLVIKAKPLKRTKKLFGHPVYGRFGKKQPSLGAAWPQLPVEPPSPDDINNIAQAVHRASFDSTEPPRPVRKDSKENAGQRLRRLKKFADLSTFAASLEQMPPRVKKSGVGASYVGHLSDSHQGTGGMYGDDDDDEVYGEEQMQHQRRKQRKEAEEEEDETTTTTSTATDGGSESESDTDTD